MDASRQAGALAASPRGQDQFDMAWRLALLGWLACVVLQLALYLRAGPYGGPFLVEWQRYFGLALYFDLLGTWLIGFPFLLVWLLLWRRPLGRPWRWLHRVQVLLITINLFLSQFDHEVLRFLGTRLSFSFMAIYGRPGTLRDGLFREVLFEDQGGAMLPLILLVAVPLLYALAAAWMLGRRDRVTPCAGRRWWLALLIASLPLAAPANAWLKATSQFRLRKTEPVILALATDIRQGYDDIATPPDLDRLVADYQRDWLAGSSDKNWRFDDPARPYIRSPTGPPPAAATPPWNLIYVQLESFRGSDVGHLGHRRPSPTPFLDSLAAAPDTAVWTRATSFGMPTINGMFATHCSISPHSGRYITSFTPTALYCLPEMLRRRGYRSEMFNAGDTDWDNSTLWLNRWYDRLWRFPGARQQDRPVFRAAARRIRELGRTGRPFLFSLVSISNHTPFTSREPRFDMAGRATPRERILNTMRYTDDVLREFVEAVRGEPWFARTLLVIVGDHGFNLGEHRVPAGQISPYRPALWVPLIIAGRHPRLMPGRHDALASLLDVSPTIADLLGISERIPWQGHSLLDPGPARGFAFALGSMRVGETAAWTAIRIEGDARAQLFDRSRDWRQERDLGSARPRIGAALTGRAERRQRLNDYLLRHDLVWRRQGEKRGAKPGRNQDPNL
jgi:phosphoglycerol transferase MdoB-like AlkP superfamily enzyme